MAKKQKAITVTASSGNVFADIGLPNADQELLKAQLTLEIYRIIKSRNLTQTDAGKILGIKQPHVSLLMTGVQRAQGEAVPISDRLPAPRFRTRRGAASTLCD